MSTREPQTSSWAIGWTAFAAFGLMLIGFFHAIAGITAIANDQFFVLTEEYIFKFDVTSWGWVHLVLGLVVVLAGFGLFSGAVWARTVGVIVAGLSIILNFAWLPWYPVWSIVMITASFFVIWALTVHGRDIAERS